MPIFAQFASLHWTRRHQGPTTRPPIITVMPASATVAVNAGQPGEQWTMFFKDPSGNALEFKAMTQPENLFAKYYVS